ncbi:restriction endonuclease subunit S [Enterococcus faecalis]|nr:restriction endonuclease subunit S [Enterococcus faecalis]MDT2160022.1 restriction endonuclease subunit S [Enterococcus faecalis]UQF13716.1 restriction endonuclease subunit S [Enterococcus faecalis]
MKKVPRLRFRGFQEDWELCKLGDVFEQTSTLIDPKKDRLELWSLTVENGLTPKTQRYNREFLVKKNDQFKAVHSNEFLYNPMNMTLGAVDLNTTGQAVAVSGYYITMQTKENFSSKYFNIWLKTPLAIKNYKLYATGSLIERQRIQFPTLIQIKAYTPQIIEQEKIGDFFQKFDAIITLHQRKLEQLKELKKAYLQLMFASTNTKNDKLPKLRFTGFKGYWELCKLSDISDKVKEKNKHGKFTETLTNSAEYGIINQRVFFDKDISNVNNLNSYYVVQNDDFVYNPRISNFAPVGPIKRNRLGRTGVMSPLYYVFRTHSIDNNYLEKYFDTVYWHHFMELNGDTGARADRFAIKDSIFVEMPIPYPSTEEQQKIGIFFKKLDQSITLYKNKLNQLKALKKAYLQNMFI